MDPIKSAASTVLSRVSSSLTVVRQQGKEMGDRRLRRISENMCRRNNLKLYFTKFLFVK